MTAPRAARSPARARLGAALVLVGLIGAFGASAALAAGTDTTTTASSSSGSGNVTFSSPSAPGAVLSQSPVILAGDVNQPGGFVDSITITVTWTDTAKRPAGNHPAQWVTYNPDVRESTVPWNYGPDVPYNGQYTVDVTATTDMGTGTAQQQVSGSEPFVVNLPPATPAGVGATIDTSRRVTNLTWKANTEPDLVGYEVMRAGPSSSDPGRVIGDVAAPTASYTDTQVSTQPAGTYRYEVIAVRQNGAGNGVVLSAPSPESTVAYTTAPKPAGSSPATTAPPAAGPASGAGSSPTRTGAQPGTTGSPPRSRIVLPAAQNSLPDYQALLNQARATTVTVPPPDPGFSSKLPYQPQVNRKPITLPAIDGPAVLGGPGGTSGMQRTVEFVAAALLLAVLAMFALILKRSAEQSAVLEALAPQGAQDGEGEEDGAGSLARMAQGVLSRGAREAASWERDREQIGMGSRIVDLTATDDPAVEEDHAADPVVEPPDDFVVGTRPLLTLFPAGSPAPGIAGEPADPFDAGGPPLPAAVLEPLPGMPASDAPGRGRRRGRGGRQPSRWAGRAALVSAGLAAEYGPAHGRVGKRTPAGEALDLRDAPGDAAARVWQVRDEDWAGSSGHHRHEELPGSLLLTLRSSGDASTGDASTGDAGIDTRIGAAGIDDADEPGGALEPLPG